MSQKGSGAAWRKREKFCTATTTRGRAMVDSIGGVLLTLLIDSRRLPLRRCTTRCASQTGWTRDERTSERASIAKPSGEHFFFGFFYFFALLTWRLTRRGRLPHPTLHSPWRGMAWRGLSYRTLEHFCVTEDELRELREIRQKKICQRGRIWLDREC